MVSGEKQCFEPVIDFINLIIKLTIGQILQKIKDTKKKEKTERKI